MPHSYDATFTCPFPVLPVVIHQVEGEAATASLNKLILLLDGPRAQTDVLTRRQADRSRAAQGQ